jgi:hypothetical protein
MRWLKGVVIIVLFGLWPFVNFAAQNLSLRTDLDLSPYRLLAAAIGTVALVLMLWLALSFLFRRVHSDRWAAVLGVAIAATFLFGPLASFMQEQGYFRYSQAVAWTLATLAVLTLVWLLSRDDGFSAKLTIVAVALNGFALLPLATLLQGSATLPDLARDGAEAAAPALSQPSPPQAKGKLPNVYFFVFDEYDRSDQLKKIFNFDNEPFLTALAERGFIVGGRSLANFPATLLSVSSTLSMRLIVAEGEVFDWWRDGARKAKRIIDGYNPVVGRFRQLGYKYIHGGGEAYVRCGNAEDLCIRAQATTWVTEQERLLMLMTPLRLFRYRLRFAANKFTPAVVKKALKTFSSQPRFVYAHFMIPRSSVSRDDCSTVAVLDGMMGVAALPRHDPELMRQRKMRYVNDLKCVNPAVLDLVDEILAGDADPIIIVQSDHGPTYLHDWSSPEWPEDEFNERYGILNAIRLPEACRRHLYAAMTPVNTFRIVLACIEDRPPQLVEDLSLMVGYYSREPARAHYPSVK